VLNVKPNITAPVSAVILAEVLLKVPKVPPEK
jgi:hypothetical protein